MKDWKWVVDECDDEFSKRLEMFVKKAKEEGLTPDQAVQKLAHELLKIAQEKEGASE